MTEIMLKRTKIRKSSIHLHCLSKFSVLSVELASYKNIPYLRIMAGVFKFDLTLEVLEMKIAEFANSVHLDEVAHHEPLHLDLPCLPSSL